MPDKKPDTAAASPPLGRPAFPENVVAVTQDPARPAGAVELQVPLHEQQPAKPGSSTLTIMNPTPTAAAPTASPSPKRG